MEKPSRIQFIDIAKGIAIILMVIGHMPGIDPVFRAVIFSFHMPLFIIANGYFIKEYDIKKTLKKSAVSLLIPYGAVCILEAVFSTFAAQTNEQAGALLFAGLNDMVVGMSKISTMFTNYGSVWLVWFVICLFLVRNLYVILMHFLQKNKILFRSAPAFLICISLLGFYLGNYVGFLPWSLDVALYCIIFIALGDMLRRLNVLYKYGKTITFISLGVWIAFLLTGEYIELARRRYPFIFGGAVAAIAGTIFIFKISQLIEKRKGVFTDFLTWCGKHSFLILGVHCIEMRFIHWDTVLFTGMSGGRVALARILIRIISILVYSFIILTVYTKCVQAYRERKSLRAETTRMDWPDAAKGMCMLAIIAGHMSVAFINQLVYLWHLPVLFIISGYFLKTESDRSMAKNKAKRLLVPYYVTCLIIIVLQVIISFAQGGNTFETFKEWTLASLYAAGGKMIRPEGIRYIGAIWFLWAAFFALLLVNHFSRRKHWMIIIGAISFAGWASYQYTGIWLPLSIQAGALAASYVALGWHLRQKNIDMSRPHPWLFCIFALGGALGIQIFKGFWLVQNEMKNGWIDFALSICASMAVLAAAGWICRKNLLSGGIFMFFGRNSLLILCLHIIDLDVLKIKNIVNDLTAGILPSATEYQTTWLVFLIKIVYVTVGVLIINAVMKCIKNNKLPRLSTK